MWEIVYVKDINWNIIETEIRDEREERVKELEEENKKLKKELELVRKNTRANMETLDLMYWENVDLKKENEELKDAMKELNNYNKFLIQENERQKSKTITVTDEDNRIILEKWEDGRWHSYWGNVVLC